MPIKMRALQRHYVIAEKHEYNVGEEFSVPTEKEADDLVRFKRATRVATEDVKPAEPAQGKPHHRTYARRDMKPEGD